MVHHTCNVTLADIEQPATFTIAAACHEHGTAQASMVDDDTAECY